MYDPDNLKVWHRALDVAVAATHAARRIRPADAPGLRNQICRAAQSIPANIAEGARQESAAQFVRFLSYAIGSTSEVESHLVLATRLSPRVGDCTLLCRELSEVRQMLCALRAHHRRKAEAERRPGRRSAPTPPSS